MEKSQPVLLNIPVSAGELLDRLSILRLKTERISDPVKLVNVQREHDELDGVRARELTMTDVAQELYSELRDVNATLWDIEDDIRRCEAKKDFGEEFIRLARAVYITNDRRAELKREISVQLGSLIVDEKSYVGQ